MPLLLSQPLTLFESCVASVTRKVLEASWRIEQSNGNWDSENCRSEVNNLTVFLSYFFEYKAPYLLRQLLKHRNANVGRYKASRDSRIQLKLLIHPQNGQLRIGDIREEESERVCAFLVDEIILEASYVVSFKSTNLIVNEAVLKSLMIYHGHSLESLAIGVDRKQFKICTETLICFNKLKKLTLFESDGKMLCKKCCKSFLAGLPLLRKLTTGWGSGDLMAGCLVNGTSDVQQFRLEEFKQLQLTSTNVNHLSDHCPNVKHVMLRDVKDDRILIQISSLSHLRVELLAIEKFKPGKGFCGMLRSQGMNIRELVICRAKISSISDIITIISAYCPKLEILEWNRNALTKPTKQDPLRTYLEDNETTERVQKYQSLLVLRVIDKPKLVVQLLDEILPRTPALRSIYVENIPLIYKPHKRDLSEIVVQHLADKVDLERIVLNGFELYPGAMEVVGKRCQKLKHVETF